MDLEKWYKLSEEKPKEGIKVLVTQPNSKIIAEAIIAFGCWRDYKSFQMFYPSVDMEWRYV